MSVATIESSSTPMFEARYNLPFEQVEHITHQFLDNQPELPAGRFFCTEVDGDMEIANVARSVERTVFDESFENNSDVMRDLYGPYEKASTFFMVFDLKEKRGVGVLRAISNSEAGLMTLNEAPEYIGKTKQEILGSHGLDERTLDSTWDIGTLAVIKEYRGKMSGLLASTLLYRAYFLAGRALNVQKTVAIIDPRARKNAALLGIPLSNICDSQAFDYAGSKDSTAVIGDFPDFHDSVTEQAMSLREKARIHLSDILHGRFGRIIFRKVAARTAGMLATGNGLDDKISLPLSDPR